MKAQTEIHFEQAIVISESVKENRTKEQEEAVKDFLESNCDLFSGADFNYYAEATGKGIDWVRENAKYSDEQGAYGESLRNAMDFGDYELMEQFI